MSRAFTKEEVREKFLAHVRGLAKYWAGDTHRSTVAECCEGVAHSMLCLIDGSTAEWPAMDLVLRPYPDDEEFCKKEGENFFKDGMTINDDVILHDLFYKKPRKPKATT